MNAPTNIQIINGPDGKPAFVVIPYVDYMTERNAERNLIPHDVVSRTVDGASPVRAWREHLGFTQADIAARLGISQSAFAQQENSDRLRKSSREKIAAALGVSATQLDF
jgi:predicted transcriptional regulator